jgi:acetyl esterase
LPVDSQAQAILDQSAGQPPLETLTVAQGRERMAEIVKRMGPGELVASVEHRSILGSGTDIPVRVYTPKGDGRFPVLVFFHGGGWVLGNLDSSDVLCRALTNAAGCIVVSVNYRHAPEHRFPAAAEDAYDATFWVAEHAQTFRGDPSRVSVGGTSAGGNLAAVVALMARDRGKPRIIHQLLSVPITDYRFDTRSYLDNADGYGLTRNAMQWFWQHYLGPDGDGSHPYVSPLRADDLRGLPPALILTAEYDPLRDEGEAYAQRLAAAGVSVTCKRYDGMVHMFLGPDSLADMAAALRTAFAAG